VALGGGGLGTLVRGWGLASGAPADGRTFPNGWVAVSAGDATTFLRRAGGSWQIAGATRASLTATYADYARGRPSTIRVRAESGGRTTADLTLRLSDVDTNVTLDPSPFHVPVPHPPP